jgi:hypothetical protein
MGTSNANDPIREDNTEQEDESAQAQTVAEQALAGAAFGLGLGDSEKVRSGDNSDAQDLVDHMRQMESSGRIDMSAYRGERNDDDEEGQYGDAAEADEE